MRNRFLFRYTVTFLVFAFALSFTARIGYGEDFRNRNGAKAQIGEKAKLLEKKLPRIRAAIQVQNRHMERLMNLRGVVGTATGIGPDGEPEIRVFTDKAGVLGIPKGLDNLRVRTEVTGKFYALQDPLLPEHGEWWWPRPVPIGVSTGHPLITAGTIGARVRDTAGNVYALSNNHVYANINNANLGDRALQPGIFDGGTDSDEYAIGFLYDFEPIIFSNYLYCVLLGRNCNTMDAAIALSSTDDLDYATPPDGYGSPNSAIHPAYGVPNVIGDVGEDMGLLLGESVQKYGRTTRLKAGTVDSINAVVNVCYDSNCQLVATFVDQLIITPATFSGGGDSGSLIVTNDANKYPVGLLFAGSDTDTIANPIDWALIRFGVEIESGPTLPSLTINDVAVNEGDEGTIDAVFEVTLSAPSSEVVTFDFFTEDDTATAGSDYMYTAGTLTFDIGETAQTITVPVSGDTEEETDETFYVKLTNAIGATIVDGQGVGTIMDDDAAIPPPPDVSIGDVTVAEGDSGTTDAVFTVTLSAQSEEVVTVDYATSDGTATADDDYVSTSEPPPLTFPIGTTTQTITVLVNGDTVDEGDETFYVNLISATGATIVDGQGVGTITNDDAPESSSDPKLWTGTVTARTDGWTTVLVGQNYIDMVVICTPNYDITINTPVTVQVKDALDDTFDVKIAPAVFGLSQFEPASTVEVHCMAVEAGVYTETEHGVKMEAVKYTSTVTDRRGSWNGQLQTYANDYQKPVVLGQVMTYNCNDLGAGEDRCHCTADIMNPGCYWNVFWSRSASSANNPPNNTTTNKFRAGKHVGEDTWSWVNDETIGYIVIEAGEGTIGTTRYYAGLGSDSIRGVGNRPPYTYVLSGLSFQPSKAILTQAAMDGGEGGWAILYGDRPIRANGSNIELRTAIEEDWSWDSERRHTTEQVSFFVSE